MIDTKRERLICELADSAGVDRGRLGWALEALISDTNLSPLLAGTSKEVWHSLTPLAGAQVVSFHNGSQIIFTPGAPPIGAPITVEPLKTVYEQPRKTQMDAETPKASTGPGIWGQEVRALMEDETYLPDEPRPLYKTAPVALAPWWDMPFRKGIINLESLANSVELRAEWRCGFRDSNDTFSVYENDGTLLLKEATPAETLAFISGYTEGYGVGFDSSRDVSDRWLRPSIRLFAHLLEARCRIKWGDFQSPEPWLKPDNNDEGFQIARAVASLDAVRKRSPEFLRKNKAAIIRHLVEAALWCMTAADCLDGLTLKPEEINDPSDQETKTL